MSIDKLWAQNLKRFLNLSSLYVLNCFKYLVTKYLKIRKKYFNLSSLYVLNCFKHFQKHILGPLSQKDQARKKFELCQNDSIFTKISELYQVAKCSNSLKFYTLKALPAKNRFYYFFLIFWHAKIPPFYRMPRYWH